MRVLIATGIFEPEAGGPATYAPKLAAKFRDAGHDVVVITYSSEGHYSFDDAYPFKLIRVVRGNRVLNRVRFFITAFREIRTCDLAYTLDWFAAGFPVALAALILRTPYAVRIGGDYLWEQYMEAGAPPLPLSQFYERGFHKRLRFAPRRLLIQFVLRHAAHVVFNSDDERALYVRHMGISPGRASVIENPLPDMPSGALRGTPNDEFVFWGRIVAMKNLDTLIRAFARAALPPQFRLLIIGDGPQKGALRSLVQKLGLIGRVSFAPAMRRDDVLRRVKDCRALILPSWTDISPNQVYEALAIGLPALVTKENYLSIRDALPATVDPASVDDIAAKLKMLADDERYAEFSRRFSAIRFEHSWDDVAREHIAIFKGILRASRTKSARSVRVLQIGADRSKRGILYPNTSAFERQKAYAQQFGHLDIIGFSLATDSTRGINDGELRVYPTNSRSKLMYGIDAMRIVRRLSRPDVVSAQDPFEAGFVGWLIAQKCGAPLHVQVHTDFLSAGYRKHSLANRLRAALARFILSHATRIRVVSDKIRSNIQTRLNLDAPITVLPIYTNVERFRRSQVGNLVARFAQFTTRILVIARLEPEKNVGLAIRAFAQSAPQDSCLIIIGTGSERKKLEALVHERDIVGRVFFEGDPPDIAPYYALADLVLVTSKYEGYGLVIVEALVAGRPVLSTDVGIAREAGAIVTTEEKFPDALAEWFTSGPRTAELKIYPYKNFDEYVTAYCRDIEACARKQG